MIRHLLELEELGVEGIQAILQLTDRFVEVGERAIPKVPALRGKTVANMFFEDSTRTRLSFDVAAKRLSADVLTFSASSSSLNKGESIRDSVETLEAMGINAIVVRHGSSGVPQQITRWVNEGISVINAGDGWHAHPTQGLLDAYTVCEHFRGPAGPAASLQGLHVGLVGDILHSRVARSDIQAYTALGATVTLIAPATLLPADVSTWPVQVSQDLDQVLPTLDVLGLLRVQKERMVEGSIGSMREYIEEFSLTQRRVKLLSDTAVITHPGPVVRGVEVTGSVLDEYPRVLKNRQVSNGVAVRMAVLFLLLGSGAELA
jgi:aspartate carbamoyltransferase catalytic subunit